jgi:two-component system, NarL family, nitrate/nitrite response regulator NarL
MDPEIRILLVDDHSLFQESLSRLLEAEPDFRVVGSCASASEAVAILSREKVDIVLLDHDLGEEQGSLFLDAARRSGFAGRVLMVTAGMSDAGTLRALESGASGIFLKHMTHKVSHPPDTDIPKQAEARIRELAKGKSLEASPFVN